MPWPSINPFSQRIVRSGGRLTSSTGPFNNVVVPAFAVHGDILFTQHMRDSRMTKSKGGSAALRRAVVDSSANRTHYHTVR